jgi:beta-mannosidase
MNLDLNKNWQIRYESLQTDKQMNSLIEKKDDGWMIHDLPCDVHLPLIENRIIKDPLIALNCFESEWIEKKSWWFKRNFEINDNTINNAEIAELVLEGLDCEADIFINGVYLGHHRSAFYPFLKDVKEYLFVGMNVILVRVTTGLEYYSDQDLASLDWNVSSFWERGHDGNRGDKRRAFVRKPQYVFGWDWGPRVATCGIMGSACIKILKKVTIRNVHVVTQNIKPAASLDIMVEIENLDILSTKEASVEISITYEGDTKWEGKEEVLLCSGSNYFSTRADIEQPNIWWPNGYGDQPLYEVNINLLFEGERYYYKPFKYGIRKLALNQNKIDEKNRQFVFVVNDVKIFCKGGNWVPADSIYGRISDNKYSSLVCEAKEQNFTMLRVWGGGLYEPNIFYEKCDENGILVWQDFMFSCNLIPEHLDWFRSESASEINYQTKRLRNYACLALWCGNNENQWIYNETKPNFDKLLLKKTCNTLFNKIMPEIVHINCSNISYWNSSPYGGILPNSDYIGDNHKWDVGGHRPDFSLFDVYDSSISKFVSEYGLTGPSKMKSVEQYCGTNKINHVDKIYRWHAHFDHLGNDVIYKNISNHYMDVKNMDLDAYLLYGGLTQGTMLQYSLEAFRSNKNCWGSLFWMYNDTWGEDGWTTIDYYLRRKISFYFVKRALKPVKLILKRKNNNIEVLGINETGKEVEFKVEYGYYSLDNMNADTSKITLCLLPHSRSILYTFPIINLDLDNVIYFIKPLDTLSIDPEILKINYFRKLNVLPAKITIEKFIRDGKDIFVTIKSTGYAHSVFLNLDADIHLSDDYFDMLPNMEKEIKIYNAPQLVKKDIKPCFIMI